MLVYLHKSYKLAKGESAIIISHFELINKLTAPILLPQPIIGYSYCFRYYTAVSTYLDYSFPRVINFPSLLSPHPLKSKQAKQAPSGNYFRCRYP
jgi:hypothetical protein